MQAENQISDYQIGNSSDSATSRRESVTSDPRAVASSNDGSSSQVIKEETEEAEEIEEIERDLVGARDSKSDDGPVK